jgi:AcrR family transcriptional regulator
MENEPPSRPASVEAILEATRRVIAERGPTRFSLSAVAARAEVSRPTLYRWFPTKDALLAALSTYEEQRFDLHLQEVIEAQPTPAGRLDAALWCLFTYLDGLMGPDPIGAEPAFALRSLASSLGPQTASFVRLLGDAFDAVPAVRLGHMSSEQAAELFLRMAYSHYLVPHPDPAVLIDSLRSLAGLSVSSLSPVSG